MFNVLLDSQFPLIPLPIIEAILKKKSPVYGLKWRSIMKFPLIPLPIIEAIGVKVTFVSGEISFH